MPRFDLIDEFTSVYVPNAGSSGPIQPIAKSTWTGKLVSVAALAVVMATVLGF
ncbi:MAG: hypothetical protein V2I51_17710 [Anderseniella sp.]|jgi:hypothetical protein|nr:hypothetical protein [Anderseniella sp.]